MVELGKSVSVKAVFKFSLMLGLKDGGGSFFWITYVFYSGRGK